MIEMEEHTVYLFPWRYRGWCHQIPFLHVWRFHFCVYKMGRSPHSYWLPNVSVTYLKVYSLKR